jgi:hypothetical protein
VHVAVARLPVVGVAKSAATASIGGDKVDPQFASNTAASVDLSASEPASDHAPPVFTDIAVSDPIWFPTIERDRTIWFALAILVMLNLGTVATNIRWSEGSPPPARQSDERGQDGKPTSIEVEIVEAPGGEKKSSAQLETAVKPAEPNRHRHRQRLRHPPRRNHNLLNQTSPPKPRKSRPRFVRSTRSSRRPSHRSSTLSRPATPPSSSNKIQPRRKRPILTR